MNLMRPITAYLTALSDYHAAGGTEQHEHGAGMGTVRLAEDVTTTILSLRD